MANIFGTKLIAHPSYTEPDQILTISQPSGFMDLFAGRAPRVRLGDTDKFVYANRIDLRSQVASQQASHNALPSATITADFLQTAAYLVRTRAEYNEIDVAEAGNWNTALPAAQRLAMRQGIFQYMRMAALFGVNSANSEGLLNTPGASTATLPPDSFGNTTILTYDAGQFAFWLLGQFAAALERMYLAGTPTRLAILGPQRIILQLQLQNIVQLTSFQRSGGGTATTAQVVTNVAKEFGYEVEWGYDDTLIGQGASSDDALILAVPEIEVPSIEGINTNPFAELSPNLRANTMQYANMAAPVEVTTPIPDGVDVTSSLRITSGWCVRSQAVSILSIPY